MAKMIGKIHQKALFLRTEAGEADDDATGVMAYL